MVLSGWPMPKIGHRFVSRENVEADRIPSIIFTMIGLLLTTLAAIDIRRVLVTGANKGIGKAICTAALLQYPDVHVVLGSRDRTRAEEAVQAIVEANPGLSGRIELVQIDVADAASVAAAAAEIGKRHGATPLFGICNNAGIGFGKGFGPTLETNYYGTVRVCEAFVPLLSPGGRVVNIASASAPMFVSGCPGAQRDVFTSEDVTMDAIEAVSAPSSVSRRYLCIYLIIYPSIHLSIYEVAHPLSIHIPIYPSIYPYIYII